MCFSHTRKTFIFNEHNIELLVPDVIPVREAYRDGRIAFPYWSQVWPSAIALAEFISNNSHLLKEKVVLELGAGLGLPSMVAAHYAKSVVCSDYRPEAVELINQSAQLNELNNLQAVCLNWNHLPSGLETDILLLSDINYEQAAFADLHKVLNHFLEERTTIILSTPQRLMAKDFVATFLKESIQQQEFSIMQNEINTPISILVLKR